MGLLLFLLLREYSRSIILKGKVYIDETYYDEILSKRITKNGKELRGISRNQYCIAVGYDGKNVYAYFEGMSKPSQKRTREAFLGHIAKGSHLIHDKEKSHKVLVEELELTDESYNAKKLDKLPDRVNPLAKINHQCYLLKDFLNAHPGFNREEIQCYLDLFCFMQNPPYDRLEKVEILIRAIVYTRITLKYRDAWQKKAH